MRARVLALVAMFGCRATYSLPAHPPPQELRPVAAPRDNSGDSLSRVRTLEQSCRAGLSQQSWRAALAARDRVLTALGAACDMEEVHGDRLLWLFRCRSEALFAPGEYAFSSTLTSPCQGVASLRGQRVNPWVCAGAALHELEGSRNALGHIELAVVGHVDGIHVRNFSTCPEMRTAFGLPTETPAAPTNDAEREAENAAANDRLSWCRAASVADKVRCGILLAEQNALAPNAGTGAAGDPCATLGTNPARGDLSVVGASTTWYRWFRAQPDRTCSPPRPGEVPDGNCIEARRVDVFVRYVPASQSTDSVCPHTAGDDTAALHCLQDCVEDATAHAEGALTTHADLHTACGPDGHALPAGWSRVPAPTAGPTCRTLDVGLVQRALGISAP